MIIEVKAFTLRQAEAKLTSWQKEHYTRYDKKELSSGTVFRFTLPESTHASKNSTQENSGYNPRKRRKYTRRSRY